MTTGNEGGQMRRTYVEVIKVVEQNELQYGWVQSTNHESCKLLPQQKQPNYKKVLDFLWFIGYVLDN